MFPIPSFLNKVNICSGHLKFGCYGGVRNARFQKFSYFKDRVLVQFARMVLFSSSRIFESPFFSCVLHVVRICSQKQMTRIATRGIVAVVAYKETVLDWSMSKLPRGSVRRVDFFSNSENPVTFITTVSHPRPAFIVVPLFHSPPKPFSHGSPSSKGSLLINLWRTPLSFTSPRFSALASHYCRSFRYFIHSTNNALTLVHVKEVLCPSLRGF